MIKEISKNNKITKTYADKSYDNTIYFNPELNCILRMTFLNRKNEGSKQW